MKQEDQEMIRSLRLQGWGYKRIAKELKLNRNQVQLYPKWSELNFYCPIQERQNMVIQDRRNRRWKPCKCHRNIQLLAYHFLIGNNGYLEYRDSNVFPVLQTWRQDDIYKWAERPH